MSIPDSSLNSSTTPSTRLNIVKPSLTAILNPNTPILKALPSVAPLDLAAAFKSSVVTEPSVILSPVIFVVI